MEQAMAADKVTLQVQLAAAAAVAMVAKEVLAAMQEAEKAIEALKMNMAVVVATRARRTAHWAGTRAAVVKAMD